MILYTTTVRNMENCELLGIYPLDVTVKSGDKMFAPTWDFLMEYKRTEDEQDYVDKFFPLMRDNFKKDPEYWLSMCRQEEPIALACYCRAGKFCHRHLLVEILEKICKHYKIPFEYKGEV